MSTNENIRKWIEVIKKTNINGCITGSCLLDANFDEWKVVPDIDIFAYSERYMIRALDILTMIHGFKYGKDTETLEGLRELKKDEWLMEGKRNNSKVAGTPLATIKLHADDGTVVNVSQKLYCRDVASVVNSFDMTIIMKGWDIRGRFGYDMTDQWCDRKLAIPNKLRSVDLDFIEVAYWTRQFDRVTKYWDRGFDTRPVAEFYIAEIDAVMETGNIWLSDKSEDLYSSFADEFKEVRPKIAAWLEDKKDVVL